MGFIAEVLGRGGLMNGERCALHEGHEEHEGTKKKKRKKK